MDECITYSYCTQKNSFLVMPKPPILPVLFICADMPIKHIVIVQRTTIFSSQNCNNRHGCFCDLYQNHYCKSFTTDFIPTTLDNISFYSLEKVSKKSTNVVFFLWRNKYCPFLETMPKLPLLPIPFKCTWMNV